MKRIFVFCLISLLVIPCLVFALEKDLHQGRHSLTAMTESDLSDMDCGVLDILIRNDRYTIGLLDKLYKQANRSELKELLQEMTNAHKKEITKLNNLRKVWYGENLVWKNAYNKQVKYVLKTHD